MRGRGRIPVCLSRTPLETPCLSDTQLGQLLHTVLRGILPSSVPVSFSSASSIGQYLDLLCTDAAPLGHNHYSLLFQLVTWGSGMGLWVLFGVYLLVM